MRKILIHVNQVIWHEENIWTIWETSYRCIMRKVIHKEVTTGGWFEFFLHWAIYIFDNFVNLGCVLSVAVLSLCKTSQTKLCCGVSGPAAPASSISLTEIKRGCDMHSRPKLSEKARYNSLLKQQTTTTHINLTPRTWIECHPPLYFTDMENHEKHVEPSTPKAWRNYWTAPFLGRQPNKEPCGIQRMATCKNCNNGSYKCNNAHILGVA